jgi:hypothetical protein
LVGVATPSLGDKVAEYLHRILAEATQIMHIVRVLFLLRHSSSTKVGRF